MRVTGHFLCNHDASAQAVVVFRPATRLSQVATLPTTAAMKPDRIRSVQIQGPITLPGSGSYHPLRSTNVTTP
jgi:hypothetical protein